MGNLFPCKPLDKIILKKNYAYIHLLRTDIIFFNLRPNEVKFKYNPFIIPDMRPYFPYNVVNVYEYKKDYDKKEYIEFNLVFRKRYHKKKRINKKWLQRYGYIKMPVLIKHSELKKAPFDMDGDLTFIVFAKEDNNG